MDIATRIFYDPVLRGWWAECECRGSRTGWDYLDFCATKAEAEASAQRPTIQVVRAGVMSTLPTRYVGEIQRQYTADGRFADAVEI